MSYILVAFLPSFIQVDTKLSTNSLNLVFDAQNKPYILFQNHHHELFSFFFSNISMSSFSSNGGVGGANLLYGLPS